LRQPTRKLNKSGEYANNLYYFCANPISISSCEWFR